MLCKYKNVLGKVNTGLHSYRILDIAVIDVILTVILAYVVKLIFPNKKFILILVFLFLLGIILHRLFCVRTTIDKLLF